MRCGLTIDTRQQKGKHLHVDRWLESHGVPYEYKKLDFGDYQRSDGAGNISIDSKKDVQELAGNVGREHARFVRELERARVAGYRLYILVEELEAYNDREKMNLWRSRVCRQCRKCDPLKDKCRVRRYKPMNGPTLKKIVDKLEREHGMRLMFCKRGDTARTICDLLGVEYDE